MTSYSTSILAWHPLFTAPFSIFNFQFERNLSPTMLTWSEEGTKVKFYGSARNFSDDFTELKRRNNLSTILFQLPDDLCLQHRSKTIIDCLVDLLNTKQNIKHLEIGSFWNPTAALLSMHCSVARAYLFEALVNGEAGDHLESLVITPSALVSDANDSVILGRYLRRNQNLQALHIAVRHSAPSLQLIATLPFITNVTRLGMYIWCEPWIHELGASLAQCSSVVSLELLLMGQFDADGINAIATIVNQCQSLEHFALYSSVPFEGCVDSWSGIGLALGSINSVSLKKISNAALLKMLPQLQCCESLDLELRNVTERFGVCGHIISRLPNLRTVRISSHGDDELQETFQDECTEMIKSSYTISKVELKFETMNQAFLHKVDSLCKINRVFGTTLVGFGPTALWTRVLFKFAGGSARANFLYRLLREKPELVGGNARLVPKRSEVLHSSKSE